MPAVTVSEANKKYLERLRKKLPGDAIPTVKDTVGLVLEFFETREAEFINWIKNKTHSRE